MPKYMSIFSGSGISHLGRILKYALTVWSLVVLGMLVLYFWLLDGGSGSGSVTILQSKWHTITSSKWKAKKTTGDNDGPERRYITANYHWYCGGFANHVWRIASLYGIGKKLGRRPYFPEEPSSGCYRNFKAEIADALPNLTKWIHIVDPKAIRNEKVVDFAGECCGYEEPLNSTTLVEASENYVKVWGNYLQNRQFLSGLDAEIREMMLCAPTFVEKLEREKEELFSGDTDSHKLCVYTRRKEFRSCGFHTEAPFTLAATNHLQLELLGGGGGRGGHLASGRISLLMIGDDSDFLHGLAGDFNPQPNRVHYMPDHFSPAEIFCFAVEYCDSMLLTMSASTYGWWMAYLMMLENRTSGRGGEGIIAYNADRKRRFRQMYRDTYPPEWVPLLLVKQTSNNSGEFHIEVVDDDDSSPNAAEAGRDMCSKIASNYERFPGSGGA